ncbi:MAG: hypothetical protein JRJ60_12665 [Deltaproteobacteria bacterium]|nr:hypothetical protein [Deltaproteobacteria bacterium]
MVVVVIEEIMQFGHEQLDVCRVSLEYAVGERVGCLTAITTTTTTTTTMTANSNHNESQSRHASDM